MGTIVVPAGSPEHIGSTLCGCDVGGFNTSMGCGVEFIVAGCGVGFAVESCGVGFIVEG